MAKNKERVADNIGGWLRTQMKLRVLESGPTCFFLSTFRMNTCKGRGSIRLTTLFPTGQTLVLRKRRGPGDPDHPVSILDRPLVAAALKGRRLQERLGGAVNWP